MPILRWFRSNSTLLLIILALGWFGSLEHRGLFFPDEGRYAEIPREMLASGDWTTPRLNDLKYLEKPPLQYWLTALSFAAFGEDEWTARLPAALLGFAAILMVAWTARRLWGSRAGLLAGAITGSSWGFYVCGQYLTLDMTLSSFLTVALCAFILAQREPRNDAQRNWMLVAWGMAALAMLSKGLIALVLPGLALTLYSLLTRDFRIWSQLHLRKGLTLFIVIAMPWFALVQLRNPEFFRFFFFHEHFQRFVDTGHARVGPWWFFLALVILGTMPWTPLFAVRAVSLFLSASATPAMPTREFDADRFCLVWAIVIVAFFSVSQSKLAAYIVPAFPALALWASQLSSRASGVALRLCSLFIMMIALLLAAATTELSSWPKFTELGQEGIAAVPILVASALSLALAGAFAFVAASRHNLRGAVTCLVAGSLLFWGGVFGFLHQTDAYFSSERIIEDLTGDTKPFEPSVTFYSIGFFDPSLPFYLGRPVTLVRTRGELGPGIDAEPEKAIASLSAFRQVWTNSPSQAYAAMNPADFERFERAGVPMTRVIEDSRVVIVSRYERQATARTSE